MKKTTLPELTWEEKVEIALDLEKQRKEYCCKLNMDLEKIMACKPLINVKKSQIVEKRTYHVTLEVKTELTGDFPEADVKYLLRRNMSVIHVVGATSEYSYRVHSRDDSNPWHPTAVIVGIVRCPDEVK